MAITSPVPDIRPAVAGTAVDADPDVPGGRRTASEGRARPRRVTWSAQDPMTHRRQLAVAEAVPARR